MASKSTEQEVELSCKETCLVLKITDLRKNCEEMKEEEISAIRHYLGCNTCRVRGLAEILGLKLSCQVALLVWAKRPGALWLDQDNLTEICAVEHVWGKEGWRPSDGCNKASCRKLTSYWRNVPLSAFNDG